MAYNITSWFTVKKLTWLLVGISLLCILGSLYTYQSIQKIHAFNKAVLAGKTPETHQQSFEAKFATALYLAKKERYKEATLLFTQLMPKGNNEQKAAVQYNIGNMFFCAG